jgi:predicted RNA polymerase sigma factor
MDDATIEDERLELIVTCCHPALAVEAHVALTLRALGGLSTEEIARAFVVSEETMKRRLSRAKAKIKATGIPFAVPADHLLPDRLNAVLTVIYVIYNEGYSGRVDLAGEAIRLGRVLSTLMPDEPEVHGLASDASAAPATAETSACVPLEKPGEAQIERPAAARRRRKRQRVGAKRAPPARARRDVRLTVRWGRIDLVRSAIEGEDRDR